ncbi:MAG: LPXTG cell wall anchor domain-containing protein [Candidatus Pacebacteria bacterium]|jgi:LPXTG-motif cell wall-anchored protein|nr:LPXTG cell wall anchor domain-containing protein [Candidatus Paceibacterota bacterium]
MKKFLISLISLLIVFPLLFSTKVKAAALQITGLGTLDLTGLDLGGSLKTYTYSGGTFALTGLASPSATISVIIDDSTQTATADEEGGWSTLLSSLTEGKHQLNLASGAETLDFVLTVGAEGSESAEVEASATTSTKTLPAAGSTTNSLLFLAFAMLSVGLGLIIRAKQS